MEYQLLGVDMASRGTPTPQHMAREPPKPMCATELEAKAWAAGWWRQREEQPESIAGDVAALYKDSGRLLGLLQPRVAAGGLEPVKLVRGSWLLERAKLLRAARTGEERARLRVPRRQELERVAPHALLTPLQAEEMPRGHVGEFCLLNGLGAALRRPLKLKSRSPLKLIAISHAWLTPEHPDPLGEQLIAFADTIHRERRCCRSGGEVCFFFFLHLCCPCIPCCPPSGTCFGVPWWGQQCCESASAFPSGEFMVFYDYASLHQKDPATGDARSDAESTAFAAALETMGTWYAHRLSTTYALDVVPPGWETTPYADRGWTTFEAAVSTLAKEATDSSWARHVRMSETARQGGGTARPPPVHPEEFAATLARKAFTNGKSDCELVAGLYADVFNGAFGAAELLIYEGAGWGDGEVAQLARVLPLARHARYLELLNNNAISAVGWRALAAAIEAGGAPRLERIYPHGPGLAWPTSDGGALREACMTRGIKLGTEI